MGNSGHCGSPPRHLERAEAVAHCRLTTGHGFWEYTSTGLAWLLTRPDTLRPHQNGWHPPAPMHWTR
ncbi:hypothetical protein TNCV_2373891 [Trichonephila clavipes]|nr:hypothetical protein TNCV_2373891 [Trichonephila clavipes]